MGELRLQPSDDVSPADWIRERLVGFGVGVYSLVPSGFPAYVRLFHPAYDGGYQDRPLRWAEVAERAGTTMHALAQFGALTDPVDEEEWEFSAPDNGNLEPKLLRALCEVLGRYTTTPASCWFCLWSGYGFLHPEAGGFIDTARGEPRPRLPPPAPPEPERPLVHLPGREYLLFSGPLDAVSELGEKYSRGIPQSPNLFWSDDRAWCVGTEIDLDSSYIGGSEALAEALLADPRLETWRVEADDPIG